MREERRQVITRSKKEYVSKSWPYFQPRQANLFLILSRSSKCEKCIQNKRFGLWRLGIDARVYPRRKRRWCSKSVKKNWESMCSTTRFLDVLSTFSISLASLVQFVFSFICASCWRATWLCKDEACRGSRYRIWNRRSKRVTWLQNILSFASSGFPKSQLKAKELCPMS